MLPLPVGAFAIAIESKSLFMYDINSLLRNM